MKKEISKNQVHNTKSLNTAELKSEDVVQLTRPKKCTEEHIITNNKVLENDQRMFCRYSEQRNDYYDTETKCKFWMVLWKSAIPFISNVD